jgi:hypothetical protein
MNVLMKNRQKKVLPFPKPPEEPEPSKIVVQIGNERFAIHYEVEDLPPVPPLLLWKRPGKKVTPKTSGSACPYTPGTPAHWTCHSANEEG